MRVFYTLLLSIFIINLSFAQTIPPKREFRAVWVASVTNIDWPTNKWLLTSQQRSEFITLLDRHKANGMNAVLVQIRPSCDAFYGNSKEPWSEWLMGTQGSAPVPFYDPLQFMIEETRKRGMEFHGWFNPYRSVVSSSSSVHNSHISKTKPEWNLKFSTPYRLLDPGIPAVRDYVITVIMDVVRRYEIDGVHFDDYFYPYEGTTSQDSASWRDYPRGFTNVHDWRRDNVNTLIRMVHDSIMVVMPTVKFGISPFGIWKNSAAGTNGFEGYSGIYCDAVAWLNSKTVDYIMPQIYWAFERVAAPYGNLVPWWASVLNGRHLYIGHGAYNMSSSQPFPVGNWPASELCDQIRFNRIISNVRGSCFFSSKHLTNNVKGFSDSLRINLYKYPALPPTMPWKDSIPPLPPYNLAASGNSISITLNWEKPLPASDGDAAKYFVIYRAASPDTININNPKYIRKILTTDTTIYMDQFSVAWNTPYTYIVTSMDKLHNESEPLAKVTFTLTDVTLAESLPKEFKLEQNYPNPFNPTTTINFSIPHSAFVTLKVYDILGREVAALVDEEKLAGTYNFQFSIVNYQLSSGIYFYQLKADNPSSSSGQVFSEIKKFIILK